MPLAYITGGTIYYVHPDHLGTPQRITAADRAVVWDASYRPFGEATVTGALTFNLRFPGSIWTARQACITMACAITTPEQAATSRAIRSGWMRVEYLCLCPRKPGDVGGPRRVVVNGVRAVHRNDQHHCV